MSNTWAYIDNAPFTPRGILINSQCSGLVAYYRRQLFQKAMSVLEIHFPTAWDKDFLKSVLFVDGYMTVFPTLTYGVIGQPCSLAGYGLYYQPTRALVTNPLLNKTYDMEIGSRCELIKLTPDYCGLLDIVNDYSEQLALVNMAECVNMINSKTANIFFAGSKAEAESYKKASDEIMSGKPVVVMRNNLKSGVQEPFSGRVRENFILPELLESQRRIENNFATLIGLPNTNTDKKERMSIDEVNANNTETQSLMDMFMENLREGFDRVNKKYGAYLDRPLTVDWRIKPTPTPTQKEGGEDDDAKADSDV